MDEKNLKKKIDNLKKVVNNYEKLDEFEKIEKCGKIIKEIRICEKIVNNYLSIVENSDGSIEYSLSNSEEENANNKREKFREYLKKIKEIKLVFESDNNLSIDEKMRLYLDLISYCNWCEEYLLEKKNVEVEYL